MSRHCGAVATSVLLLAAIPAAPSAAPVPDRITAPDNPGAYTTGDMPSDLWEQFPLGPAAPKPRPETDVPAAAIPRMPNPVHAQAQPRAPLLPPLASADMPGGGAGDATVPTTALLILLAGLGLFLTMLVPDKAWAFARVGHPHRLRATAMALGLGTLFVGLLALIAAS